METRLRLIGQKMKHLLIEPGLTHEPTIRINLVLQKSMHATMSSMAKQQGCTVSDIARILLAHGIEQESRTAKERPLPEYKKWSGGRVPHPSQARVANIAQKLLPIVKVEGPVTTERAYRAYINGAGHSRVTKPAQEQLDRAVVFLLENKHIKVDETDKPYSDQPQSTLRIRRASTVVVRKLGVRELYEVPLPEIAELINRKLRRHSSMNEEALMRYVLDTYKLNRLTGKREKFLGAALQLLENPRS